MENNGFDGFELAKGLISEKVLEELKPEWVRSEAPNGAVLISCGDRDRFDGFFSGCASIIQVHPIVLNGGGLLLADGIDEDRRRIILEDCQAAFEMKKMDFVFLLSHFPCGKAGSLHIGLRETILKTLEGKKILKKHLGTKVRKVLPIIGIDWRQAGIDGEDGVKLYAAHISKANVIASFGLPKPERHYVATPSGCAMAA